MQETADMVVVDALKVIGLADYDETRCLIALSQTVQGHTIYCGHPKASCPRPKHRILQRTLGRRGQTGVYQQLPNSQGTTCDAVADTRLSTEEWAQQQHANRVMLETVAASPEKIRLEEQYKPRAPKQVQIDTSSPGPRARKLQTWAQDLPQTPTATDIQIAPPTPKPATATPKTLASQPVTSKITAQVQGTQPISIPTNPSQTQTITLAPQAVIPTAAPQAKQRVTPTTQAAQQGQVLTVAMAPAPASTPPPAPAPKSVPGPVPPGPPPAVTYDPPMASLLTTLISKFDDMTAQQTTMLQEHNSLLTRMTEQAEQSRLQQDVIERLRQTAGTQPPLPSDPVPANVSVPSGGSKTPRYYAVAKGRRKGVFTRWKDAKNSVKGYSGAVHKRFRSKAAAEQWLRSKGTYGGNDDASDISTDDFGSGTIYGGSGASRAPSVRPIPPQRPSAIIDVKHIGPDSSVGKPNEIYGTSIQAEPEISRYFAQRGLRLRHAEN
jgi:hypothetical protein